MRLHKQGDEILGCLEGDDLDHAENAKVIAVQTLDWAHIAERSLGCFREII
jgi:hypothetical protein